MDEKELFLKVEKIEVVNKMAELLGRKRNFAIFTLSKGIFSSVNNKLFFRGFTEDDNRFFIENEERIVKEVDKMICAEMVSCRYLPLFTVEESNESAIKVKIVSIIYNSPFQNETNFRYFLPMGEPAIERNIGMYFYPFPNKIIDSSFKLLHLMLKNREKCFLCSDVNTGTPIILKPDWNNIFS